MDATGRYVVSSANNGQLIISPVTEEVVVKIAGHTGGEKYNGKEQTVSGFGVGSVSSNVLSKNDIELVAGAVASVSGTDAGEYGMGLSSTSFKLKDNVAKNFTNVKFEVEDGVLTIAKRKVTIWSQDAHKNYDGKTLINRSGPYVDNETVYEQWDNEASKETKVDMPAGDGFVEGEGFKASSSVTWDDANNIAPGVYENKFTISFNSNTNAKNYDIEYQYGKLYVNKRVQEKDKYKVTITANSDTTTYDGTEKSVSGVNASTNKSKYSATGNTFTNDKGVTFTISGYSASAKGTDAGTYNSEVVAKDVKVVDPAGNDVTDQFTIETANGVLTIDQATVTLTAGSAKREYNGTPLTSSDYTAEGFAEKDKAGFKSVVTEGSQTNVGSSENAIVGYEFADGVNSDNYVVATQKGTLTVTNRAAKYVIEVEAKSAEETYNGEEHTVSGIVADAFTVEGVDYKVSGLTAEAKATDAGTYTNNVVGTAKVTDPAGNDVTDQFSVATKSGTLRINPRKVTLTSADGEKPYDGTALTNDQVTATLTDGGEGSAFVKSDGATYNVTGSITDAGVASNTFTYALNEGTKAQNYTIAKNEGKLEVTANEQAVIVAIKGNTATEKYSGTEQSITGFTVSRVTIAGEASDLYGAVEGVDFTFNGEAKAVRTDAGEATMGLAAEQFTNISKNFSNVTFVVEDGFMAISKLTVTLTSASDEKSYDGSPLTNNIVTVDGDGFANGEGAAYDVTGTITDAGKTANAFTYTLNANTKAENYNISTKEGDLEVKPVADKVTVTVTGHKGGQKYSGSEQVVSGYDVSIDNALYAKGDINFSGKTEVARTNAGTYPMGLSEGDFANGSKNFSNVKFVVNDGALDIAKREVSLTSASDRKEYDGTPLTNNTVTVEGDGFVEGEGATFTVTGSRTAVGSNDNVFTYSLNDGTDAGNYAITTHQGTLTVFSRDAKYAVTVVANSATESYDGKPHQAAGVETYEFTVNNQKFTVEGLTTSDPTEVNAGTYSNSITGTPVVKDAEGNDVTGEFAISTQDGALTINKRDVTLTSSSAKREYTGAPLTNGNVVVGGQGFAEGEGATYDVTGTITNVGTQANTFTYQLNAGTKVGNYNITTDEGKLEVTPVASEVVVTVVGNSASKVYTGKEQSVTGYKVTGISNNLLKESDIVFAGAAEAKGIEVGTYGMGLASSQFSVSASNKNFSKVTFAVSDGELTITPQSVEQSGITVDTPANHVYDGKEHKWTPTVIDSWGNTLNAGIDYDVTYTRDSETVDDFTNVTGPIVATVTGKGNYAGEVTRTYQITKRSVVLQSDTHSKPYDGLPLTCDSFGWCDGVVSVGTYDFVAGEVSELKAVGSITEVGSTSNDVTYKKESAYRDSNYDVKVYPGTLTVTPKAITASDMQVGQLQDVVYSGVAQRQKPEVNDGDTTLIEGRDYTLSFSEDVTNVGTVKVVVTGMGNYAGMVERSYRITPATLTVETPYATQVYNGSALTADGSISGFVGGETAPFDTTGMQVEVGSSSNTYVIDWGSADATAQSRNYVVSASVGTLTVTSQSIVPGTEDNPNTSYKGVTVSSPADIPYDGGSHVWEPVVADADGNTLAKDVDYTVTYTAGQDFTNVTGDIVVTITGVGNYSGMVEKSYRITPLPVVVETGSGSKSYDGEPLTNSDGAIGGLIAGESGLVTIVPNGSQVAVGSSKNTYDINWNGVNASNYKLISENFGTLTVTPQSIDPGTEEKPNPSYKGASVSSPSDSAYNGEAHQWTPTVTGKDAAGNEITLVEGADYEVSYARDGEATTDFTNAGTITVTIVGKGDYTGSVTRTYQITPASLTIATPGDEKTYDGKPLTKSATAAECVSGLVKNETIGFKTTGSQTKVGSSDNTYEIEWTGTAKESNYRIASATLGKLVVKESADEIVVTTTGGEFTYDGQAHGATVSVSELPTGYTLEAAESSATATDVTESDVPATADTLVIRNAAGEDVTAKLNIKKVDGAIKVIPATLTVTTPDAEKTYDGSVLRAAGTVTGFVNSEEATFATTGSQTQEGSSTNAYEITWNKTAKQGNYTIVETLGTLKVTAQSIVPGTEDKPNPAYKGVQVGQLDNTVYNGSEQKFEPKVTDANGAALVKDRDYTLTWSDDVTNAGTVTVTVTGKGNYAGSVTRTYAIAKRPISLKSESATQVYNGKALERPNVAVTSYYDFVAGEVESVKAMGSVLNAGSEKNAIAITGVAGKYDPKNYDVTFDEGTMTVTKADAADGIALQTKSSSKVYDGSALELPEAAAAVANGQGANVVTIEYQKADGSWTQNAGDITATDVADSREVTERASSETNYEGYAYGKATLSIGARNVMLSSASASKVYNGEALTAPAVEVTGDGFVAGEVTDIAATGSVTEVGTKPNAIGYKTGENFKPGNYSIQEQPGMLTVTTQSIEPGTSDKPNPSFLGVEVSSPNDSVYDGQAHQWVPTVMDKDGNKLVEGADYTVAYSTDDFTNVTGAITVTITGKGNYAGTVTRTYEITPAPVKVETFGDSKTYDGIELTAGGQVTGVVAGETYSFQTTGSQTAVGSSDNTYSLTWDGTAKQANYQVVETKIGKLTVNEAVDVITVTTTGGEFAYDGQAHGATVAVTGLPAGYHVEQAYSNATARNVADGTVAATADVLVIKNAQGEDVTGKLNINRVDGSIVITKAPLTITTGSASKQYDGVAATSDDATAQGAKGTDRVTVWATGEQTEPGSSANTYGIYWGGADQGNYEIAENLGKLEVSPNTAPVTIEGASASKTYDGLALATNDVKSFSGLPAGFSVELAATGSQTDAATSENTVGGYTITSTYGDDATAYFTNVTVVPGTLTVDPAELAVTTQGGEKTYDGTPLTNANGTVEGLVNGEIATVVPNGSQTEVGASSNGYDMQWGTAKSGNYKIASATLGELRVNAQSITPGDNPDNPDPAYRGIQVSSPSDVTYDGQAHQWAPEVTAGGASLVRGTDYDVTYNTTDFTNVTGAITVTITGKGNYAGTVTRTYQVTPRDVVLTSASDAKQYDGVALERPEVAVSGSGFVDGEVSGLAATGSALNAGDSATNAITYAKGAAYRDANYSVTKQEGTLSVYAKQLSASDMAVGSVGNVTYNGLEQKQKPEVRDGSKVLAEGVDYDLVYSENVTDAGAVTVTVVGKGNYAGSVDRFYIIKKAPLTAVTDSASKAYDGSELTAAGSATGFVNGETATFAVTGAQTTVGSSKSTYEIAWDGTAKAANYSVAEAVGTLTVTESENEVVVTTTGGMFTYDGQAHGATVEVTGLPAGYTAQASSSATATDVNGEGVTATADNLVIRNTAGDDVTSDLKVTRVDGAIKVTPAELTVTTPDASKTYDGTTLTAAGTIAGFVNGEMATLKATGSQTEVGSSQNTYEITWDGSAKQGNYTVAETLGTLTVSAQAITPGDNPENPDPAYRGIQVSSPVDVVYNGQAQRWAPEVRDGSKVLSEGTDYDVAYSTTDFTNVTGAITATITGKGNYMGTVTRTYEITPAPLTVTTESATRAYNGQPLTAAGSLEGLVAGETATFAVTGEQTNAGASQNGYTLTWDGSAKASNYSLSEQLGTLTVSKADIAQYVTLETADAEKTYDGTPLEAGQATATDTLGNAVQVQYSVDGQNWFDSAADVTATNVNDSCTVLVRATSDANCAGSVMGSQKLTVNKRTVELSSESASKTYDGTALEKPEVTVAGDGFVKGEVSNVRATGSIENVGSITNAIAYDRGAAFNANNYAITEAPGTLTVVAKSIIDGVGMNADAPVNVEYDGLEHKWVPTVTDGAKTLANGIDYSVAYSTSNFVDATGAIAVTIAGTGNYTGTIVRTYEITPAPLSVETFSDSKVYDGTALTAGGKLEGLKNGETATFAATGSQTAVGSSENGYTLAFDQTAKGTNYRIASESLGTLSVTESADEVVVTTTGGTFEYDGQAHGATVTVSQLPAGYTLDTAASTATATNVADGVVAATADQLVIRNAQGQDVTSQLNIVKVDGSIEVTPATLTVATAGSTKQFDSTPLTNGSMSITGLVPGDSVTAKTTGSQTEVGSSKNTYEITWSNADQRNYTVVEQLGDLTVTAAPVVPVTPAQPGGTTPGGTVPTPSTPGTTPGGTATPAGTPATPANPVDAIAQVLESAVDAITGASDQPAEKQIFDDENPLGAASHANCWVHYLMLLGMILTVLYGASVAGRRTRFAHNLNANMNDVLGASEKN